MKLLNINEQARWFLEIVGRVSRVYAVFLHIQIVVTFR